MGAGTKAKGGQITQTRGRRTVGLTAVVVEPEVKQKTVGLRGGARNGPKDELD